MNQNFLIKLSKVILTVIGIAFTTSLFSPALGQLSKEPSDNTEIVSQRVLQKFTLETGIEIPNSEINFVIESEKWSDTCLELPEIGEQCFNTITPGWRVVINKSDGAFIYHTNNDASVIKLEKLQDEQ
jgi:hypothetical protein